MAVKLGPIAGIVQTNFLSESYSDNVENTTQLISNKYLLLLQISVCLLIIQ